MHVVTMLLRFVAPMARAVVGDLLLHAVPCPRLIGFHLRAPVGRSLWLHAGHSWYPPRATRSALAPLMARGCALGKANEASGLTGESRYSIYRVDAHAKKPTGDQVWLKHGAEPWGLIAEVGCGPLDVTAGALAAGPRSWLPSSAARNGRNTRPRPSSASFS